MNCSNCGKPMPPIPEMSNYALTLVLFYKQRRCTGCRMNTAENYDDFLKEFAKRLDGKLTPSVSNDGSHSWTEGEE